MVDLAAREGEFRRLSLAAREKDDRRPPRDLRGEGLVLRELEPREVVPVRLLLLEEPVEEVVLLEVEERTAPTEWRPVPRCTDRRRRRARSCHQHVWGWMQRPRKVSRSRIHA